MKDLPGEALLHDRECVCVCVCVCDLDFVLGWVNFEEFYRTCQCSVGICVL